MPQILKVVRQHILGVVSIARYCSNNKFNRFPAVKAFENRLRFDEIIVTMGCAFLRHSVYHYHSKNTD